MLGPAGNLLLSGDLAKFGGISGLDGLPGIAGGIKGMGNMEKYRQYGVRQSGEFGGYEQDGKLG